jgi:perosamine synthetase
VAQLQRLPEILSARAQVADWYNSELQKELLVTIPYSGSVTLGKISWFVYVVRFCDQNVREIVAQHLNALGIETRPYFPAIHLQPLYRKMFDYTEGSFPVTESVASTSLALPFYTKITLDQVRAVCDSIKNALRLPEIILRIFDQ